MNEANIKTPWYLYIIRCRLGTLYTGITNDLTRRFNDHVAGRGAKYLRGKGPLKMVFSVEVENHSIAAKLEAKIKKCSRLQKESIIAGKLSLPEITDTKTHPSA